MSLRFELFGKTEFFFRLFLDAFNRVEVKLFQPKKESFVDTCVSSTVDDLKIGQFCQISRKFGISELFSDRTVASEFRPDV